MIKVKQGGGGPGGGQRAVPREGVAPLQGTGGRSQPGRDRRTSLTRRPSTTRPPVAGSAAARAAVQDAQAELEKAKAKSEAAHADVKVAESLVGVARKDKEKAQALLSFATIRAPFDGVITRRNVDPGDIRAERHDRQHRAAPHRGPRRHRDGLHEGARQVRPLRHPGHRGDHPDGHVARPGDQGQGHALFAFAGQPGARPHHARRGRSVQRQRGGIQGVPGQGEGQPGTPT